MEIRHLTASLIADVEALFAADRAMDHCRCMWFIIPVRLYHAQGASGNRAAFARLAEASDTPLGLVGFEGDEPVAWCALGARRRFARAILTPTYRGRDSTEDESVWLIPCVFVRGDRRRAGLTAQMIKAAVEAAQTGGAKAIEAFPLAGGKRQSKDVQVGFEQTFAREGFRVIARPSENRALMRLDFA
jgi:GNAT superfamily N-acetyltransferase